MGLLTRKFTFHSETLKWVRMTRCYRLKVIISYVSLFFFVAQNSLSSNVLRVVASDDAFCAVKSDGSVITWGNRENGGDQQPKDLSNPDWDVQAIRWADPDSLQATCCAFGFLRKVWHCVKNSISSQCVRCTFRTVALLHGEQNTRGESWKPKVGMS